jgi:hypothetical protein
VACIGAVLSSFAVDITELQQVGGPSIRHICDPPRRRACQSVLARSRAPFAPLSLRLWRRVSAMGGLLPVRFFTGMRAQRTFVGGAIAFS